MNDSFTKLARDAEERLLSSMASMTARRNHLTAFGTLETSDRGPKPSAADAFRLSRYGFKLPNLSPLDQRKPEQLTSFEQSRHS
jgi:hypothetical protein